MCDCDKVCIQIKKLTRQLCGFRIVLGNVLTTTVAKSTHNIPCPKNIVLLSPSGQQTYAQVNIGLTTGAVTITANSSLLNYTLIIS